MLVIDQQVCVGQLVRECPSRSRVFDRFGIDFCCGGKITLAEACRKRSLDTDQVLRELQNNDRFVNADPALVDADAMGLAVLCDHIESTHHMYLKIELPRLDRMTEKVTRLHGNKEPKLLALREAFVDLKSELEPHMMKEERVLFPLIRELESMSVLPHFHCGTLGNPIAQMEKEHDHAGDALARIRSAADNFVPPDWACNTYRAMLKGLLDLEHNMHQHVHKETNVLFLKALKLEASFS